MGHPCVPPPPGWLKKCALPLDFRAKTAQDARQFCVRRFWGPFGFQIDVLGVKLDPFRTLLKVQWGTCVLRRRVFRSSNVYENRTGRSPIFGSAVLGPFWVPNDLLGVKLEPFRNVKVQRGTYVLRRLVLRTSNVIKNSTGRPPIFFSAVLGPFWVPNAPLGV